MSCSLSALMCSRRTAIRFSEIFILRSKMSLCANGMSTVVPGPPIFTFEPEAFFLAPPRLRRSSAQYSKVSALADGFGARLELPEDSQGTLVNGGYNSGWHSIKRRAEIFVGFRHAPLFQQ
jgi:hypothetical protein